MRSPVPATSSRANQPGEVSEFVFWGLPILLLLDYLGVSSEVPVLRVLRIPTLLAWGMFAVVVFSGGARAVVASRQGRLLLGLLGLAGASILYAVVKSYVPANVRSQADYFILFVISGALIDRRSRVAKLAVMGTGLLIILVLRNLDGLSSGLRVGSFRAGPFMGDGNDFAWGLIALLPLPLFLMLGKFGVLTRAFGLTGVTLAILGVVGTQSRGATLAVVIAGTFYWLALSKRRALGLAAISLAVLLAITVAPSTYFDRITSTDIETDTSAQGRLHAWNAAFRMALDYPLGVGVGSFNSAYGRFYITQDEVFQSRRWISAHSIYFKVLAESGFLGLLLLIGVLATNFRDNLRSFRQARAHPDTSHVEDRWPAVLNLGLVGYAIAGAFLGGIAYPHLYLLSGLTVSCRRLTLEQTDAAPVKVDRRPRMTNALVPRQTVPPVARRHARL
jgi:putative inorganic carbon (HCO3(-)) transporter